MDETTDLVHHWLRTSLGWPNLLSIAVFTGLAWWSGWASLRLLRRQPDFPGKDEMRRGARWGWAGLLGVFVVYTAAVAALIAFLPWKLTALVSHNLVGILAIVLVALLLRKRLDLLGQGLMIWSAPYSKPFATGFISRRSFDIHEWLAWSAARRERAGTSRWGKVARWSVVVMWVLIVGSSMWMGRWVWRIDRDTAEQARLDQLAAALTTEMNDPQVAKLEFLGKMTSLARRDGPALPAAIVELQPDASQEEAERVARGIEDCLRRHRERDVWQIRIGARRTRARVLERYDPRTGQATPMPYPPRRSIRTVPAPP